MESASPKYIHSTYATTVSGFDYTYDNTHASGFEISADAATCGTTGSKDCTIDATAAITCTAC